jgi:hypothetical protein
VVVCPVGRPLVSALGEVSETVKDSAPSTTSLPVWALSSTDWSVVDPVELVVSAVEFQTAATEVYRAVTVEALGAGGGITGHIPAVFGPLISSARVALPTTRLLVSNRAPPDAPAPTLPAWFTTPQKDDA